MPTITRQELEQAQRDASDLGKVVNGAADLANPGQDAGTVSTRLGRVVKTLAKIVVDAQTDVEAKLKPIIYTSSIERENGLPNVTVGQTCFDKEDTNLYICLSQTSGTPAVTTKYWTKLSDLQLAASADLNDLLTRKTAVGRVSIDDFFFLKKREEIFDKNYLTSRHARWPYKATTGNGLRQLLSLNADPTTDAFLLEGSGFGCRFPQNQLTNVSTAPVGAFDWSADTKRIQVRNENPNLYEKLYVPGYIDINSGYQRSTYIRDCLIDTNYEKLQAISKNNPSTYPVFIEYCTLRRFTAEAISLLGGHIAFCSIELSRGDGLKAGGVKSYIHGNMVRLLGQDLPTAHADVLQVLDVTDLQVTGNTFYMPGTGTFYGEGTYGSTQVLRLITENSAHNIRDVYVGGNLFVGGGFSVAVRSRFVNCVVENVVIANNIIAGKKNTYPYWVYGPITQEHWIGNNPGTIRNLIFWNNKMSDGTNFATEIPGVPQGGSDQNGIWHFSKEHASARFLELGKQYGLLDWNGDLAPGVNNRTTG